jgi:hypothetical protein
MKTRPPLKGVRPPPPQKTTVRNNTHQKNLPIVDFDFNEFIAGRYSDIKMVLIMSTSALKMGKPALALWHLEQGLSNMSRGDVEQAYAMLGDALAQHTQKKLLAICQTAPPSPWS